MVVNNSRGPGYIRLYPTYDLRSEFMRSLSMEEKWVWVSFRLLVADCPWRPTLCIQRGLPFTDKQIAQQLEVNIKLWMKVKQKLIDTKRIEVVPESGIYVPYYHMEMTMMRPENKALHGYPKEETYDEYIKYTKRVSDLVYELTGRLINVAGPKILNQVKKRVDEGATEELIERAVRSYCWILLRGIPDKGFHGRIWNLFRQKIFWHLAKNGIPLEKRVESTIEYINSLSTRDKLLAKYYAKEYVGYIQKIIVDNNYFNIYFVDFEIFPTCKEYIISAMKEEHERP